MKHVSAKLTSEHVEFIFDERTKISSGKIPKSSPTKTL